MFLLNCVICDGKTKKIKKKCIFLFTNTKKYDNIYIVIGDKPIKTNQKGD